LAEDVLKRRGVKAGDLTEEERKAVGDAVNALDEVLGSDASGLSEEEREMLAATLQRIKDRPLDELTDEDRAQLAKALALLNKKKKKADKQRKEGESAESLRDAEKAAAVEDAENAADTLKALSWLASDGKDKKLNDDQADSLTESASAMRKVLEEDPESLGLSDAEARNALTVLNALENKKAGDTVSPEQLEALGKVAKMVEEGRDKVQKAEDSRQALTELERSGGQVDADTAKDILEAIGQPSDGEPSADDGALAKAMQKTHDAKESGKKADLTPEEQNALSDALRQASEGPLDKSAAEKAGLDKDALGALKLAEDVLKRRGVKAGDLTEEERKAVGDAVNALDEVLGSDASGLSEEEREMLAATLQRIKDRPLDELTDEDRAQLAKALALLNKKKKKADKQRKEGESAESLRDAEKAAAVEDAENAADTLKALSWLASDGKDKKLNDDQADSLTESASAMRKVLEEDPESLGLSDAEARNALTVLNALENKKAGDTVSPEQLEALGKVAKMVEEGRDKVQKAEDSRQALTELERSGGQVDADTAKDILEAIGQPSDGEPSADDGALAKAMQKTHDAKESGKKADLTPEEQNALSDALRQASEGPLDKSAAEKAGLDKDALGALKLAEDVLKRRGVKAGDLTEEERKAVGDAVNALDEVLGSDASGLSEEEREMLAATLQRIKDRPLDELTDEDRAQLAKALALLNKKKKKADKQRKEGESAESLRDAEKAAAVEDAENAADTLKALSWLASDGKDKKLNDDQADSLTESASAMRKVLEEDPESLGLSDAEARNALTVLNALENKKAGDTVSPEQLEALGKVAKMVEEGRDKVQKAEDSRQALTELERSGGQVDADTAKDILEAIGQPSDGEPSADDGALAKAMQKTHDAKESGKKADLTPEEQNALSDALRQASEGPLDKSAAEKAGLDKDALGALKLAEDVLKRRGVKAGDLTEEERKAVGDAVNALDEVLGSDASGLSEEEREMLAATLQRIKDRPLDELTDEDRAQLAKALALLNKKKKKADKQRKEGESAESLRDAEKAAAVEDAENAADTLKALSWLASDGKDKKLNDDQADSLTESASAMRKVLEEDPESLGLSDAEARNALTVLNALENKKAGDTVSPEQLEALGKVAKMVEEGRDKVQKAEDSRQALTELERSGGQVDADTAKDILEAIGQPSDGEPSADDGALAKAMQKTHDAKESGKKADLTPEEQNALSDALRQASEGPLDKSAAEKAGLDKDALGALKLAEDVLKRRGVKAGDLTEEERKAVGDAVNALDEVLGSDASGLSEEEREMLAATLQRIKDRPLDELTDEDRAQLAKALALLNKKKKKADKQRKEGESAESLRDAEKAAAVEDAENAADTLKALSWLASDGKDKKLNDDQADSLTESASAMRKVLEEDPESLGLSDAEARNALTVLNALENKKAGDTVSPEQLEALGKVAKMVEEGRDKVQKAEDSRQALTELERSGGQVDADTAKDILEAIGQPSDGEPSADDGALAKAMQKTHDAKESGKKADLTPEEQNALSDALRQASEGPLDKSAAEKAGLDKDALGALKLAEDVLKRRGVKAGDLTEEERKAVGDAVNALDEVLGSDASGLSEEEREMLAATLQRIKDRPLDELTDEDRAQLAKALALLNKKKKKADKQRKEGESAESLRDAEKAAAVEDAENAADTLKALSWLASDGKDKKLNDDQADSLTESASAMRKVLEEDPESLGLSDAEARNALTVLNALENKKAGDTVSPEQLEALGKVAKMVEEGRDKVQKAEDSRQALTELERSGGQVDADTAKDILEAIGQPSDGEPSADDGALAKAMQKTHDAKESGKKADLTPEEQNALSDALRQASEGPLDKSAAEKAGLDKDALGALKLAEDVLKRRGVKAGDLTEEERKAVGDAVNALDEVLGSDASGLSEEEREMLAATLQRIKDRPLDELTDEDRAQLAKALALLNKKKKKADKQRKEGESAESLRDAEKAAAVEDAENAADTLKALSWLASDGKDKKLNDDQADSLTESASAMRKVLEEDPESLGLSDAEARNALTVLNALENKKAGDTVSPEQLEALGKVAKMVEEGRDKVQKAEDSRQALTELERSGGQVDADTAKDILEAIGQPSDGEPSADDGALAKAMQKTHDAKESGKKADLTPEEQNALSDALRQASEGPLDKSAAEKAGLDKDALGALKLAEDVLKRRGVKAGDLTEEERKAVGDAVNALDEVLGSDASGLSEEEREMLAATLQRIKDRPLDELTDEDRAQLAKALALLNKKKKKADKQRKEGESAESLRDAEKAAAVEDAENAADTLKALSWLASDGKDKKLNDDQADSLTESASAMRKVLEEDPESLGLSDAEARNALTVLNALENKKAGDTVSPEQLEALGKVAKMVEEGRDKVQKAEDSRQALTELERSGGQVDADTAKDILEAIGQPSDGEPSADDGALAKAMQKTHDAKESGKKADLTPEEQNALSDALRQASEGPLDKSAAEKAGLDKDALGALKLAEDVLKRRGVKAGDLTEEERKAVGDAVNALDEVLGSDASGLSEEEREMLAATLQRIKDRPLDELTDEDRAQLAKALALLNKKKKKADKQRKEGESAESLRDAEKAAAVEDAENAADTLKALSWLASDGKDKKLNDDQADSLTESASAMRKVLEEDPESLGLSDAEARNALTVLNALENKKAGDTVSPEQLEALGKVAKMVEEGRDKVQKAEDSRQALTELERSGGQVDADTAKDILEAIGQPSDGEPSADDGALAKAMQKTHDAKESGKKADLTPEEQNALSDALRQASEGPLDKSAAEKAGLDKDALGALKLAEDVLKRRGVKAGDLTEEERKAVGDAVNALDEVLGSDASGLSEEEREMLAATLQRIKDRPLDELTDEDRAQLAKALALLNKKKKKADKQRKEGESAESLRDAEKAAAVEDAENAADTLKALSWLASDGKDKKLNDDQADSLTESASAMRKVLEEDPESLGLSDAEARNALTVLNALENKKAGDTVSPEQLEALGKVAKMVEEGRDKVQKAEDSRQALTELERSGGQVDADTAKDILEAIGQPSDGEPSADDGALAKAMQKTHDAKESGKKADLTPEEQNALSDALRQASEGPLDKSAAEKAGLDKDALGALKLAEDVLKRRGVKAGDLTEEERKAVGDAVNALDEVLGSDASGLSEEEREMLAATLQRIKDRPLDELTDEDRAQLAKALALLNKKKKKADKQRKEGESAESLRDAEKAAAVEDAENAADTLKALSWLASDGKDKKLNDDQADSLTESASAMRKVLEEDPESLGLSDAEARNALTVLNALENKKAGDTVSPEQLEALGKVAKMVEEGRDKVQKAEDSRQALTELERSGGQVDADTAKDILEAIGQPSDGEPSADDGALAKAMQKTHDAKESGKKADLTPEEQNALSDALRQASEGPLDKSAAEKAGLDKDALALEKLTDNMKESLDDVEVHQLLERPPDKMKGLPDEVEIAFSDVNELDIVPFFGSTQTSEVISSMPGQKTSAGVLNAVLDSECRVSDSLLEATEQPSSIATAMPVARSSPGFSSTIPSQDSAKVKTVIECATQTEKLEVRDESDQWEDSGRLSLSLQNIPVEDDRRMSFASMPDRVTETSLLVPALAISDSLGSSQETPATASPGLLDQSANNRQSQSSRDIGRLPPSLGCSESQLVRSRSVEQIDALVVGRPAEAASSETQRQPRRTREISVSTDAETGTPRSSRGVCDFIMLDLNRCRTWEEMIEAQLNYIRGQTDLLLETVDSSPEPTRAPSPEPEPEQQRTVEVAASVRTTVQQTPARGRPAEPLTQPNPRINQLRMEIRNQEWRTQMEMFKRERQFANSQLEATRLLSQCQLAGTRSPAAEPASGATNYARKLTAERSKLLRPIVAEQTVEPSEHSSAAASATTTATTVPKAPTAESGNAQAGTAAGGDYHRRSQESTSSTSLAEQAAASQAAPPPPPPPPPIYRTRPPRRTVTATASFLDRSGRPAIRTGSALDAINRSARISQIVAAALVTANRSAAELPSAVDENLRQHRQRYRQLQVTSDRSRGVEPASSASADLDMLRQTRANLEEARAGLNSLMSSPRARRSGPAAIAQSSGAISALPARPADARMAVPSELLKKLRQLLVQRALEAAAADAGHPAIVGGTEPARLETLRLLDEDSELPAGTAAVRHRAGIEQQLRAAGIEGEQQADLSVRGVSGLHGEGPAPRSCATAKGAVGDVQVEPLVVGWRHAVGGEDRVEGGWPSAAGRRSAEQQQRQQQGNRDHMV
uniref:EF-hand domain-containing protein n=1 Tax=Macrostomum lignano TaxID=282301 RepID=A0A1I8I3S0_9PLAT